MSNPETVGNQFGHLCPKCKQGDCLSVVARIWVGLEPDGTDPLNSDHEWDENSAAYCSNCEWHGRASDFVQAENFESE
jgi:hypothetical protein